MKAESSQAGRRAFLANVVYLFIALPCLFTKLIFTCQRERETTDSRHTQITLFTVSVTPAPHSKK